MRNSPAGFRTVDFFCINTFTPVESNTAMSTSSLTTLITNSSRPRSGPEFNTALTTRFSWKQREGSNRRKLWIVFPEFLLSLTMTKPTESNQIIKRVSCFIVSFKQSKRTDMVDWMSFPLQMTMLACIVISLFCGPTLLNPIRTPIGNSTSFPSYITRTRIERRISTPLPITIRIAEMSFTVFILTRLYRLSSTAFKTFDFNSFATNPNTVNALPMSVATKSAKMVLRYGKVVLSSFNFLTTQRTRNENMVSSGHSCSC